MRKGKRWLAAAVSAAMIVQSLASVGPVYAADDGVSIADTFTDSSFRSYVSSNFDKDSNGYLSEKMGLEIGLRWCVTMCIYLI